VVAEKAVRDSIKRDHEKYWEFLTGLKTCKEVFTRTLCQKKQRN
jgi:hypothetical protein